MVGLDLLPVAATLCCCCLIVLGAGGAGFYFWRNSQKKSSGVIDVAARPAEAPRAAEAARPAPAAPPLASQETVIFKRPVAEPPAEAPKPEPVEPAKPAFDLPKAEEDVPSASFTEAPTLRWPAPDLTITPPEEAVEAARAAEAAPEAAADVVESAGAAAGGLFGLPSVEAPGIPAAPEMPAADQPAAVVEPSAAPEFTLPINDEPPAAPSVPDLPSAGDDSQRTMLHMPRPAMPDLPSAADPNQTIVATPRPASGNRAPDIRGRLLALNGADKPYEVSESGFRIMFAPKAITGYLLEIAFDFITGSARFTETGPVDDGRIKRDAREVLEASGWTID